MQLAQLTGEKQWWAIALVLGFFAFALYANTIPNSYALDDELVTRNHPLTSQGIKAIPEIFTSYYYDNKVGNYYEYRPVVLSSYAIEHSLVGDNPHVGHAINALLYGLLCMVLFFVLRSLMLDRNWLFPALATLLFAAHPIHTEVVASIKNRDELFSFLFGISAMFWALKYARQGTAKEYVIFLLLMVLAVMSKRTNLTYTVIIPLAACWLSQASLVRLLTISFPLMLIVLFFSPIHGQDNNGYLAGAVMAFPVFAWTIKTLLTQGWAGIWGPLSLATKELLSQNSQAPTTASKQQTSLVGEVRSNWLSFAVLGLLSLGSFAAMYVDLRAIMWICLVLTISGTFFVKGRLKHYPILFTLLNIGVIAANFSMLYVTMVAVILLVTYRFVLQVPLVNILSMVFALMVAVAYVFLSSVSEATLGYFFVVFIWFSAHFAVLLYRPKYKKVIPILMLVMAFYHVYTVPIDVFNWLVPLVVGLFLLAQPYLKKTVVLYWALASMGIVAILAITVLPKHRVANPLYDNNLGAYYASLPDPYGDGLKTITQIVPVAGREVDFVENPLAHIQDYRVRLATGSKVMGYYTYLMVVPLQFRYYYGYNQIPIVGFSSPVAWLCLIGYLALLVLAFWLYNRDVLLSFSLLYMLLGLLFISNIGVIITGIVAERLAFGTSLGFCMLLALLLVKVFKLPLSGPLTLKGLKPVFIGVVVLVVGAYTVRTVLRNTDWRDKETLYTHDAKISPNSAKTQQLIGNYYLGKGIEDIVKREQYFKTAEPYLLRSLQVAPKFHNALFDMAYMYAMRDDCKNSLLYFDRFVAVSLLPPKAYFSYALCLDMVGRYNESVKYYEKYIAFEPYNPDGYSNLSYLYFRMGDTDKSFEIAKRATEIMPDNADNYINAGAVFLETNRPVEAIPYFEKAYTLRPNDLRTVLNLWDLHSQVGDPERGKMFYQKAIELGHKF